MPTLGVIAAVINDGQVLLTERQDFRVWCLPGGQVDAGETVAEAAIRELREETGLTVELTQLVGIYSRPQWIDGGDHMILFAATPIGGVLRLQETEVTDAGYFSPDALPDRLLWWHRVCVQDAFDGIGGSVAKSINAPWPFEPRISRTELYAMRDRGDIPPHVIDALCALPERGTQTLEVGRQ